MSDANIQTLHEGKFLRLLKDRHWEYVTRTNSTGAAFILAVTPEDELLLVEQYRYPLQARTIELPAGMIGDDEGFKGEAVEASALRELEEETGYRGSAARTLISGPVAAGLASEQLHLVQVTGLTRVHDGGGVAGEDITVHRVPLAQVHDWLQRKRAEGLQVEPRIYAALYFHHRG
ncbi:NUDIX hydrolase [Solimonas sp. SE-A11]|uniref:NUDIX hydrolase n=1 Tax=Solimonas sp. SE-A11 TaxID=3054954 RepID=UPI00259CB61F|nr:NUDIX hydrolase [Solimonas sp. SE-A11]MDM4770318.1 NUDIX hydrolase [Solimonas sp. SE-A11]